MKEQPAQKKEFEGIDVGAGWTHEGKNGKFISLKVKEGITLEGGDSVLAFENKKKREGKNDPDYRLLVFPDKKEQK